MRSVILALLLIAAAAAQPIPPTAAVIKGTPPGGSGGACSPASLLGYLDSTGTLYTCPNTTSTWTAVSGSGGFVNSPSWTITTTAITPPGAPTVTVHGTTGSTTYGYKIAFRLPNGNTASSTERTITNGNATLDGTNYNIVTAPACTKAGETADIYLTTAGGNAPDAGFLANVACGASFNHQGQDGDYSQLAPSTDSSTGAYTVQNLGVLTVGLFGSLARTTPQGNPVSLSVAQATTEANSLYFTESAAAVENTSSTTAIDGTTLEGMESSSTWMGQSPVPTGLTVVGQSNYAQVGAGLTTGAKADGTRVTLQGGLNMALVQAADATTVTAARGVVGGVDVYSGTVTDAAAIFAHNGRVDGHATNKYGVYVESVTGGDSNYAIKTGAGIVDFASATEMRLPAATTAPPYLNIGTSSYGPLLTLAKPPASNWSWANQGTSTATSTNGSIALDLEHNSGNAIRGYLQAVPSSSEFTLSVGLLTANPYPGICVTDGTKYLVFSQVTASAYHYDKWNTTTSNATSSTITAYTAPSLNWFRITLSGGTYTAYVSADGLTWRVVTVDSSGFLGTPTAAGACAYTGDGDGYGVNVQMTLASFSLQ